MLNSIAEIYMFYIKKRNINGHTYITVCSTLDKQGQVVDDAPITGEMVKYSQTGNMQLG